MVSLDSSGRQDIPEERSQFNDEIGYANEEEELCGRCTSSLSEPKFRQLHTLWLAAISLLFLIILVVLVVLIPVICHNNQCSLSELSIGILLQVFFWCLILVIDQYYRRKHRYLRQFGYLQFCDEVRDLKRAPLFIFSLGNVLLLVCIVGLHEYCPQDDLCVSTANFHPFNVIQALITLEILISFPFIILYMIRIVRFNKQKLQPDIHQEDSSISYSHINLPEAEIGYRFVPIEPRFSFKGFARHIRISKHITLMFYESIIYQWLCSDARKV
ncbi:hypothetical protein CHUAL_007215 [Chamberlinius hualienensis]